MCVSPAGQQRGGGGQREREGVVSPAKSKQRSGEVGSLQPGAWRARRRSCRCTF